MGAVFNTTCSLVATVISGCNRRRSKRKIDRINEQNKNIRSLGNVRPDHIIPCNYQMGNIIISGGTEYVRNDLIVQNCMQSSSVGMPVIVIHEGNYNLEHQMQSTFSGHRYLRVINASNTHYDPVFRLNDTEIGHFVSDASSKEHKVNSAGASYVSALSKILRIRGVTPYMRMLASCPHSSVNSIILNMEQAGTITTAQAASLRNDVAAVGTSLSDVEYFFQQAELESNILAWKKDLSRCTSVAECIRRNGIMCIDITSCGRHNQLAMMATEIEHCAKAGVPFRVIVDAVSISGCDRLVDVLRNCSNTVSWTISSPDINRMIGNAHGGLPTWLALSHVAVLFSHGIKTCELLSAELGEYERIDITETTAGNSNLGRIGYHFGANSGFSTSTKRERVIRPEEIEALGDHGFIMLDNHTASLCRGTIK